MLQFGKRQTNPGICVGPLKAAFGQQLHSAFRNSLFPPQHLILIKGVKEI